MGSPLRHSTDIGTSVAYYRGPSVRARMLEYCGAEDEREPSAVYVAGLHADLGPLPGWDRAERRPITEIGALWDRGCDIARSLWDRRSLVFLIELDYENIDQPAESYLRPADVFIKLEPAYRTLLRVLRRYQIRPCAIATGRGYQFTGRIPLDHALIEELASLAPEVPAWHATIGSRIPAQWDAVMSSVQARAYVGLGMIVEYAAHLVMSEAAPVSALPVVFNGTIVGTGVVGRECVSIDFSYAGDPLDTRHCRAAFSTYQWHQLRPDIFGDVTGHAIPPLVALPREHRDLTTLLLEGRDLTGGARLAPHVHTSLPDVAEGLKHLCDDYAEGQLAAFHRRYYQELRAPAARPKPTPAGTKWPPCVTNVFRHPNDLLLKPEHIQHVVRALMARGWTPADIAHLVREKYEEDHGWGDRWTRMHPRSRAEFEVRVFAGMIATGLDALIDYNCVSAREKDLCPGTGCPFNLRDGQVTLRMIRA